MIAESRILSQLSESENTISRRNNVTIHGTGDKVLMLAHGFGCDQRMWRFVLPALVVRYTVVMFDYVGSGNSDLSSFSVDRYDTLQGYAQDVLDIIDALRLENVTLVGHSVSGIVGMIASIKIPEAISQLVMVCPSPCFLNDLPDYEGGFEKRDLEELMQLMDKNYIGWANYLAPLVMGANSSKAMVGELSGSFCSTDPVVAKTFANATFFSDHRNMLPICTARTLILQSATDSLASIKVGEYMQNNLKNSELQIMETVGHCVHMTNPDETARAIERFVG